MHPSLDLCRRPRCLDQRAGFAVFSPAPLLTLRRCAAPRPLTGCAAQMLLAGSRSKRLEVTGPCTRIEALALSQALLRGGRSRHLRMMLVMDATILLDEPFTFTQQRLMLPAKFLEEARKCGLWMSEQELEAWHRVRLLVPAFRVARDGRAIASLHRQGEDAYQLAYWQPTSRNDLLEARSTGLLHDPACEAFIARRRLKRKLGEFSYDTSVYLYSRHQLMSLLLLKNARPQLSLKRVNGEHVGRLTGEPELIRMWRERAMVVREIALAATLLEPLFYSRLFHRISLPHEADFAAYDRWRRRRPLLRPLRLLGVAPLWLAEGAKMLHAEAHRIDPLGDWAEVVAAGDPGKWATLTGDARAALELRISAEFLLLYYDELQRARRAPPLAEPPPRMRGPFDDRLRSRRPLNALLTDFGLSPHPHLVLAVEGETELVLMPRVMDQLGMPTNDDFVAVEDAGGVDRDLSPLVAYAVAPRLNRDADTGGRYLRLERPPTRLFVVFDAEGEFATPADRRDRRDKWVSRIMQTLPRDLRTPVVAQQIRPLVTVATWTRTGTSFEFAHFTDREIASASARLDKRSRKPTFNDRVELVSKLRAQRGNLDKMLGSISKVALADELWPVLERKIEVALARGTERRIPIVRVVHQAYALATELPRRNLVIALERQRRRRRSHS
jgi:hypothetical protein